MLQLYKHTDEHFLSVMQKHKLLDGRKKPDQHFCQGQVLAIGWRVSLSEYTLRFLFQNRNRNIKD